MSGLTKTMREILQVADLDRGEINNVPLGTMYGLERRGLIYDIWRRAGGVRGQSTAGGRFPHYYGVKLTDQGFRSALSIKRPAELKRPHDH